MGVTGADERIHPVEDQSKHWSDSLYFNAWDGASGLFLLTRMAVLPNKPGATAGLLAWQHGTPFGGYGHNLDDVPLADWDDMTIGGLRYRELEPLHAWEMTLDAGENRAYLRWDGFTGVVDYADNAQALPRAVAWGHYEQTCRVTGELTLAGRTIEVDGVGQRDHSWGFRHWTGLQEWHWVTGFLGSAAGGGGGSGGGGSAGGGSGGGAGSGSATERSFNLFHVIQPDGTVTVNGFVHDGGTDHLLVGAERTTVEDDAGTRSPQSFDLALTVEGGRRFTIHGDGDGVEVPVRPAAPEQGTVVHERLMRLRSDDGLEGAGIYELLENTSAASKG